MKTTARALNECKRRGWFSALVERRLPHTFTTVDAFGFIDVLALDGCAGVLGIQATGTDFASHKTKIEVPEVKPKFLAWLRAGNRAELWGFRKLKVKRGGKKVRWTLRRERAFVVDGNVGWTEVEGE